MKRAGFARTLAVDLTTASVVFFLFSVVVSATQDTTGVGAILGTVTDAGGLRVPGVRICVLGAAGCATTGERGSFRVPDVRAGRYQLEVIPPEGLPFVSEPVEVRAGLDSTVEVVLPRAEPIQETVSVSAPTFRVPEEVKTSGFLVEPREILKSAGALQDVSRYVQSLPGVAIGTNDFRNDIIVRGGSPLENLFIVDNVEVPNVNTFANFASAGGTVSILDAELLQDVTFLTGGYPAPYVNRTSSVLQITQREGNRREFRSWATLGFAGVGAILEGPVQGGRGSWLVSARRSFLDVFSDDIGFGGVPVLYTLNGKFVYDISDQDRVWAINLTGIDEIRLGLTDTSPIDEELYNFDIRYDGWRTATGFNWQRIFGRRGVGLLGVTHSEAHVGQQVKDLVRDGVPAEGTPAETVIAGSPVVFTENSTEGETTFKYDLTLAAPFAEKIQTGGNFKIFRVWYDSAAPFGTDNPYSPRPDRDAFAISTRFTAYQSAAYLQVSRNVTSRLSATVGARLDHFQYLGRTRLSPRAAVGFRLTDTSSTTFSYGRYYQQPFFLFVESFAENRNLVPWTAEHFVAGWSWTPGDDWRVTVEGYYKDYDSYAVATDYPSLSLANVGDTFNVREILFPLTSVGNGESRGVEVFAEKKLTDQLYGQANLAVSRTRHAGLDGILRPGSFDYPLVANVVGGYVLSPRWEVSLRAAYLSGRPYTPFDEEASTAQRRGVYDLERVNDARLADYLRLDLRVDRTFSVGGQPLVLFVGVQNLTNRQNAAGYQWNRRLNAIEFSAQQGIFPVLGFEWSL